jgi:phenol 2-monooxygenase (NADPH)
MPVFRENVHAARDLRILPSRALPLPRRSPPHQQHTNNDEKYEVVVIGVYFPTQFISGNY